MAVGAEPASTVEGEAAVFMEGAAVGVSTVAAVGPFMVAVEVVSAAMVGGDFIAAEAEAIVAAVPSVATGPTVAARGLSAVEATIVAADIVADPLWVVTEPAGVRMAGLTHRAA